MRDVHSAVAHVIAEAALQNAVRFERLSALHVEIGEHELDAEVVGMSGGDALHFA